VKRERYPFFTFRRCFFHYYTVYHRTAHTDFTREIATSPNLRLEQCPFGTEDGRAKDNIPLCTRPYIKTGIGLFLT